MECKLFFHQPLLATGSSEHLDDIQQIRQEILQVYVLKNHPGQRMFFKERRGQVYLVVF